MSKARQSSSKPLQTSTSGTCSPGQSTPNTPPAQVRDPLWQMPLWAGYEDDIASKVADVNNVSASTFAGAIIGALFLQRFVTLTTDWMHVDLFAWNPRERPGRPVGAEPQAVRALFALLTERYG